MAEPGWYPDPEGAPGRFRYWDGQRWAAESVDAPPRNRRRYLMLGATLLAAVVIMVGIVVVVRPDRGVVPDAHPPAPGKSGWDDSGPTASASPTPSSTPTASRARPSKSAATISRPSVRCPDGEPRQAVKHAHDGRVHGGQLSFAPIAGHGFGSPRIDDHYSWWYDEHAQTAPTKNAGGDTRTARVAVGSVAIRDGFRTAAKAAKSSIQCVISTGDYAGYTGQHTVGNHKIKVDGQAGRELITDVSVRTDDGGESTDRIRLIVVDAGAPGSFSIFVGVAPVDDRTRTKIISRAADGLKVGY